MLDSVPLKRFYRYSFTPLLAFYTVTGRRVFANHHRTVFPRLPVQPVLTLQVCVLLRN